jgi:hypothetical protein
MQSEPLKGQILLTTLLVLIIVAIIVVGVIAVVRRDVQQTVANELYQDLYNVSENSIFEIIDLYTSERTTLSLSQIQGDMPTASCSDDTDFQGYRCEIVGTDYTTVFQLRDTSEVTDYELGKDESLQLGLNGYRGDIILSWSGEAALEFGLVYLDGSEYKYIGDLYDKVNVFDESGNDPLTDPPPENHAFPFDNQPVGSETSFKFNIANITGLPGSATTQSLVIRSRVREEASVIKLNVKGDATLADQIREFIATSYKPNAGVDVVASVKTQVPLFPQVLPIFYYALGVDGPVAK